MVNDVSMILFIFVFFIGLGTLLPFIQADFNQTQITPGTDALIEDVGDKIDVPTTSIWKVLGSILKMFFWTFGDLPIFIDAIIMTPIRLTFVFLIARNIWIGGGG